MASTAKSQHTKRSGALYIVALAIVLVVSNVAGGLYAAADADVPREIGVLSYFLLSAVVYYWFRGFAAEHRLSMPFEMGLFIYVAWWAIVPFDLIKVHRARGLWRIAAFIALYVACYALSVLAYYAVR